MTLYYVGICVNLFPSVQCFEKLLASKNYFGKNNNTKSFQFFSGLVTKILEMFSHYDNFFNHGCFLPRLDCIYTENLYFKKKTITCVNENTVFILFMYFYETTTVYNSDFQNQEFF